MADISKVGLPTYLSDYSFEGDPSTAPSLVANITNGALLITGTVVASNLDGSVTLVNLFDTTTLANETTGTLISKTISPSESFYLSSIMGSASAGPCKVIVQSINGSGTATNAVSFFSSANLSSQVSFHETLQFTDTTVQVCLANNAGNTQSVYANLMGKLYAV